MTQSVVLVASAADTTTIVNPVGSTVQIHPIHSASSPNFIGDNAQWISNINTNQKYSGETLTFRTLFSSACPNAIATMKIAADNNSTVFFNGDRLLIGYEWTNIYTINLKLKCGQNNLTVIVGSFASSAALIFSISQS